MSVKRVDFEILPPNDWGVVPLAPPKVKLNLRLLNVTPGLLLVLCS